ncbi:hypothetical protein HJFPF1_08159 [Paramyrothecium foliicola]|nr:hypothetical protein HJFPF1_08159 [Paramyrothecium foliicola]
MGWLRGVCLVLCTSASLFASMAGAVNCYHPDGDSAEEFPCNSDETHSPCCRIGDLCATDGICKSSPENFANDDSPFLYRGSSTEFGDTVTGPATTVGTTVSTDLDAFTISLSDETASKDEPTGLPDLGRQSSFPPASIFRTSAQTSQTAESSPPNPGSQPGGSLEVKTLSVGIGLGIGIAAFLIIAIATVLFCVRRRRARRAATESVESPVSTIEERPDPGPPSGVWRPGHKPRLLLYLAADPSFEPIPQPSLYAQHRVHIEKKMQPHCPKLLSLAVSLVLLPTCVRALCYFPDGSTAAYDTPCRDDTAHSACCGLNFTCLSNGMCRGGTRDDGTTDYGRGSCTDKSWRNGACPGFCSNPKLHAMNGGQMMGRCDGKQDRFFCIDGAGSDCDAGKNILAYPQNPTVVTTIGVAPTSTSSALQESTMTGNNPKASETITKETFAENTDTPKATGGADNSNPKKDPSSQAQNETPPLGMGIGIGAGVGALLFLCMGVAFFFYKRRKNMQTAAGYSPPPFNAAKLDYFNSEPTLCEVPATPHPIRTRHELV